MQINSTIFALLSMLSFIRCSNLLAMTTRVNQNLIKAAESGSIEKVQKTHKTYSPKATVIEALEIAVCQRNTAMVEYFLTNDKLPLNTCISRLENPLVSSTNAASFTLLETALIYHEDNGKSNLPIIELLLYHGAKRTPKARAITQMPGKESAFILLYGQKP